MNLLGATPGGSAGSRSFRRAFSPWAPAREVRPGTEEAAQPYRLRRFVSLDGGIQGLRMRGTSRIAAAQNAS